MTIVSQHAHTKEEGGVKWVHTSQNVLPSESTSGPPLEDPFFTFLEALAGLSSPESSLATKLLRRLPMVMRVIW